MKHKDQSSQDDGNAAPSPRREFFEAWEIFRSDVGFSAWKPPRRVASPQHRHDEFQPVIPRQVALQQSLPPLHRLPPIVAQGRRVGKLQPRFTVDLTPGYSSNEASLFAEFPTRYLRVSFLYLTRAVVVIHGMTNLAGVRRDIADSKMV